MKLAGAAGDPDVIADSSRTSTMLEVLLLQDAQIIGHKLSELALRRR